MRFERKSGCVTEMIIDMIMDLGKDGTIAIKTWKCLINDGGKTVSASD